ncbi:XrtA system polysaccharide chain length determinant [Magnetofaba australis]|nr:XrtA system polysaccharide chain length determinant [Magnetofaba australis]
MQEFGIRELYYQVFTHLRGMWRHRWQMVVVAWFVCVGGWGAVFMMKDHYIARAQVVIEDPQQDLRQHLRDMMKVGFDVTSEARRILNNLRRPETLSRVVQETDLSLSVHDQHDLEEVISKLQSQLVVAPVGGNRSLYTISHRHTRPEITQQVVSALLKILMENSVEGVRNSHLEKARVFFEEKVTEYKNKMAMADLALQDFKRQHPTVRPGEQGDYYSRLSQMQTKAENTRIKLRELEQQRQALAKQLDELLRDNAPEPIAAESNSSDLDAVTAQRIAGLEAKAAQLLAQHYMLGSEKRYLYNEEHPDIIALRGQVETLRQQALENKQRMREMARHPSGGEMDLNSNPAVLELKRELSRLEAQVSSTVALYREYTEKVDSMRASEGTIPGLEAEFMRLKKARDDMQLRLNELMSKQGETQFTGDVAEDLSKKVRILIKSAPRLPVKPAGPNRPLFLSVVLGGGVLAGIAMGLFLSVMRPVFDSPSALKKELGLPVLGTVSMVQESGGKAFFTSPLAFILAFIVLLGLYGGAMSMTP